MQVERKIDDTNKEVWNFSFISGHIVLNEYLVMAKEGTRRSKFRITSKYDRLNKRDSSISEENVPLPENVKQEALKKFISDIRVIKWSEK